MFNKGSYELLTASSKNNNVIGPLKRFAQTPYFPHSFVLLITRSSQKSNTWSCEFSSSVFSRQSLIPLSLSPSFALFYSQPLSFPCVSRTLLQLVCGYKAAVNQGGLITRTHTCVRTHTHTLLNIITRTNKHTSNTVWTFFRLFQSLQMLDARL